MEKKQKMKSQKGAGQEQQIVEFQLFGACYMNFLLH